MELTWQPELDDTLDALRAPAMPASRRRGGRGWRGTVQRLLLAGVVVWALVALALGNASQVFTALLALIYLCGLLGWASYAARRTGPRVQKKRLQQQQRQTEQITKAWQKYDTLRAPLRAVISRDHGLQLIGVQETSYPWTSVRWVTETERSLVVHSRAPAGAGVNLYSKLVFALGLTPIRVGLPKRAFADAEQLAELRALLTECVPGVELGRPTEPLTHG